MTLELLSSSFNVDDRYLTMGLRGIKKKRSKPSNNKNRQVELRPRHLLLLCLPSITTRIEGGSDPKAI